MSAVQIPKQILEYLVGREYLIQYFLQILQYLLQILEYLLRLNALSVTLSVESARQIARMRAWARAVPRHITRGRALGERRPEGDMRGEARAELASRDRALIRMLGANGPAGRAISAAVTRRVMRKRPVGRSPCRARHGGHTC